MYTSSSKRRVSMLLAILSAFMLVAAACGGGSTGVPEAAVDPTPTAAPEPTATPAPEPTVTPEPTATPEPEVVSWADGLDVGSCFDARLDGDLILLDGIVDCAGPHDYEVFAIDVAPGGPDAAFEEQALWDTTYDSLCEPSVVGYFGAIDTVLPFPIFTWTPTSDEWAAGDRTIACTAGSSGDDNQMVGTAAAGTLTSDEAIVSRGRVDGVNDYFFSTQHSSIARLTDGNHDLANVSVQTRLTGFMFGAPLYDGTAVGAEIYNYQFETDEIGPVNTGLDGWEKASPHLILDPAAFMFAARETETDDWDIYISTTDDGAVALTDNPGNDRWPTLTPDDSQIVYHSTQDGVGSIWIMDTDGANKRQLTDDAANDFESAVSPDGSKVVFASDRAGNDDIWMMDIDGSNPTNLTNHPAADAWPFWSEDGQTLYFQTDRFGGKAVIMIMELDGSNQSIFSFELMTNAQLLPQRAVELYFQDPVFIGDDTGSADEASGLGVVPGAEGDYTQIVHTTGRIAVRLPAGWSIDEPDTTFAAQLVAASDLQQFDRTWLVDGFLLTLVETDDLAEWDMIVDGVGAATGCDLDTQSTDISGARLGYTRRYSCGEASAIVVASFDSSEGLGLIIEGQADNLPDDAADDALWSEVIDSVTWE